MIPSIVKTPVSLAHQIATGALHVGLAGASAVLRRVLPVGQVETGPSEPQVSTEPVIQPPTPDRAPAPKVAAKKKTPSKPAAALDEPTAPVDDDPVVYSSGPEVTSGVPADDLEGLRSDL